MPASTGKPRTRAATAVHRLRGSPLATTSSGADDAWLSPPRGIPNALTLQPYSVMAAGAPRSH
jgi:hypothetical protein